MICITAKTKRKAQAAMEFLMTYGWAIIVVLVVIAALAYLGILSPAGLLPDRCNFQVGVHCADYSISSEPIDTSEFTALGMTVDPNQQAYALAFDLTNNLGQTLYVTKISVSGDDLECMDIQYAGCDDPTESVVRDMVSGRMDFSKKCFSIEELCGSGSPVCSENNQKEVLRWGDGESLVQKAAAVSTDYLYIPCSQIPAKGQKMDATIKIEYSQKEPALDQITHLLDTSNIQHSIYGELKATVT